MQAVLDLEKSGYVFTLEGDGLSYKHKKAVLSDFSKVSSLLEQVRKNKEDAITFLREREFTQLKFRLEYNRLLEREKKAEAWLNDPNRTDGEVNRWLPLFNEILAGLNKLIGEIGVGNCSSQERTNGFNVLPLLGNEVSFDELPQEWRDANDRNKIA